MTLPNSPPAFLHVVAAGPMSLVQDLGRPGFARFGVPESGALDPALAIIATSLAGNTPEAALVESTLQGDTYEVEGAPIRLAIAGAAAIRIGGKPAEPFRSHTLIPGTRLEIGAIAGMRAYIAVSGGVTTPLALGSRSSHLRSGIGSGRLTPGTALPVAGAPAGPELAFDPADLAAPGAAAPEAPIRLMLGPQQDFFTPEAIATLVSAPYEITAESDRMGIKLSGPDLPHRASFNIVSDGVVAGSIQVPGSRQPILVLADHQTTGGYPKIATVISADLRRFAALRPGDRIRFAAVSAAEARVARAAFLAWLADLPGRVFPLGETPDLSSERLLGLNLVSGVQGPETAPASGTFASED